MSDDEMETTAEERAEWRRWADERGNDTQKTARAYFKLMLRDFDRLLARVKTAEAERDANAIAMVDARIVAAKWQAEASELAGRALPNDGAEYVCFTRGRFDEMLKEKADQDAERDAATARIAELEAGLRAFKIACGLRARSLPSKGQPT